MAGAVVLGRKAGFEVEQVGHAEPEPVIILEPGIHQRFGKAHVTGPEESQPRLAGRSRTTRRPPQRGANQMAAAKVSVCPHVLMQFSQEPGTAASQVIDSHHGRIQWRGARDVEGCTQGSGHLDAGHRRHILGPKNAAQRPCARSSTDAGVARQAQHHRLTIGPGEAAAVQLDGTTELRGCPASDGSVVRQQRCRVERPLSRVVGGRRRPDMNAAVRGAPQGSGQFPPADTQQARVVAADRPVEVLWIEGHSRQGVWRSPACPGSSRGLCTARCTGRRCGRARTPQVVDSCSPDTPWDRCVGVHKGEGTAVRRDEAAR